MKPGGGRGNGAFPDSEHGLIILCIRRQRPRRPFDIGRQRQGASAGERIGEVRAFPVEAQRHAAIGVAFDKGRGEILGAVKHQHIAGAQPARVARQGMPGSVRARPVQRDADPRFAAPGGQLGRDDFRVVADQDIAGEKLARKIANETIHQTIAHHQQPGRVAWLCRCVRDAAFRQIEIEVRRSERGGRRRGRRVVSGADRTKSRSDCHQGPGNKRTGSAPARRSCPPAPPGFPPRNYADGRSRPPARRR